MIHFTMWFGLWGVLLSLEFCVCFLWDVCLFLGVFVLWLLLCVCVFFGGRWGIVDVFIVGRGGHFHHKQIECHQTSPHNQMRKMVCCCFIHTSSHEQMRKKRKNNNRNASRLDVTARADEENGLLLPGSDVTARADEENGLLLPGLDVTARAAEKNDLLSRSDVTARAADVTARAADATARAADVTARATELSKGD